MRAGRTAFAAHLQCTKPVTRARVNACSHDRGTGQAAAAVAAAWCTGELCGIHYAIRNVSRNRQPMSRPASRACPRRLRALDELARIGSSIDTVDRHISKCSGETCAHGCRQSHVRHSPLMGTAEPVRTVWPVRSLICGCVDHDCSTMHLNSCRFFHGSIQIIGIEKERRAMLLILRFHDMQVHQPECWYLSRGCAGV
jgi:hypothetical protein